MNGVVKLTFNNKKEILSFFKKLKIYNIYKIHISIFLLGVLKPLCIHDFIFSWFCNTFDQTNQHIKADGQK